MSKREREWKNGEEKAVKEENDDNPEKERKSRECLRESCERWE